MHRETKKDLDSCKRASQMRVKLPRSFLMVAKVVAVIHSENESYCKRAGRHNLNESHYGRWLLHPLALSNPRRVACTLNGAGVRMWGTRTPSGSKGQRNTEMTINSRLFPGITYARALVRRNKLLLIRPSVTSNKMHQTAP